MAIKKNELGGKAPAAKASEAKVTESTKQTEEVSAEITSNSPNLEIHSKALGIVANLGDPSIDDVATIKNEAGEEVKDVKPRVVGYRFKNFGEEPINYVEYGLSKNWKRSDRMNFDDEAAPVSKQLLPGETVDLTIYEAAFLCSTEQINGRVLGSDYPVHGSFTETRKGRNASVEEAGESADLSFRLTPAAGETGFTTRDIPYVEILTFDIEDKDGRKMRKNLQIKPGFERFAVIAENRNAGRRPRKPGAARAATQTRSAAAAKFFEQAKARAAAASK